jgi:hypothetical protein
MGKKRKYNKKLKKAKCPCQNRLKKAVEKAQRVPPKPKIDEDVIFNKKKPSNKTRKKKR